MTISLNFICVITLEQQRLQYIYPSFTVQYIVERSRTYIYVSTSISFEKKRVIPLQVETVANHCTSIYTPKYTYVLYLFFQLDLVQIVNLYYMCDPVAWNGTGSKTIVTNCVE